MNKRGNTILFLLMLQLYFYTSRSKGFKLNPIPEYCFLSAPESYFDSDENLVPPVCKFEVESTFPSQNITCPEKGVMRIIGEYLVVQINCTATYPLDFNFNGVTPTEAISINLRRTVMPNSNRENSSYHTDLKIYSVMALSHHYNSKDNGNSIIHTYSRTGNYVISGYHDLSYLFTSVYIFFEEPSVTPDFIRNKNIRVQAKGSLATIPCRTTHYTSFVKLFQNGLQKLASFSPTEGFSLSVTDANLTKSLHCVLDYNGYTVVIVVPNSFHGGDAPGDMESDARILPVTTANLQPISFGSYGTKISCRIANIESYGDSARLTAIGASNAPMHKLTRDFTLPEFVGRSYSALVGQRESDFRHHLKITTLIHDYVISAVCGNETIRSAMSFGTTISCEIFPFTFYQEWSSLDRDQSNADRYFLIGNNDENNEFYENEEVEFKCRISSFIMTPPAIWYVTYANGTVNEEFIDEEWEDGISYFKTIITPGMEQVTCAAAIWFKDEWWNKSVPIKIKYSSVPEFDEEASSRSEESFTINSKRLLRCRANGTPSPAVFWLRNEKILTNRTLGESIFQIQKVNTSDAGDYICVAQNYLGAVIRLTKLSVVSGSSNSSVVIGVASATVVIICVALSVCVHFFKKKKGGLSKGEIVEFMEGKEKNSYESHSEVYNALAGPTRMIPYDKRFEISQKRFQIDKTYILGSGAYGVVYKGLLDGKPVAVKTVKELASSTYLKSLLAEIKVMIYLEDHNNLIKLLGAYTKKLHKGKVYVFVNYCPLGSLEKFLRDNRGSACLDNAPRVYSKISITNNASCKITLKDLYNWSIQIADGMAYLSKKKVIHGDLAARNVLLTDNRTAKITDFGLSRRLYDYAEYVRKKEERLPWRWLALESLKDLSFSTQSDIWSYGVTLWEIFSLAETPYSGVAFGIPFVTQIENGMRLPPPQFSSPELYNAVLMACWNSNPDLRPSFTNISDLLRRLSSSAKIPCAYLPHSVLYTRALSIINSS